jgi:hypothetical protein
MGRDEEKHGGPICISHPSRTFRFVNPVPGLLRTPPNPPKIIEYLGFEGTLSQILRTFHKILEVDVANSGRPDFFG